MKTLIKTLSIFIVLVLVNSCTNPMDIDTPRDKKTIPGEDYKIEGKVGEVTFEENGTDKNFITKNSYFMIDTTLSSPRAWLRLKLDDYSQQSSILDRMCIQSLELNLDSIDLTSSYVFDENQRNNNYLSLKIERGLNTSSDTTLIAGDKSISTEISFMLNKAKGELWAQLNAKLYDNKIWMVYRDSTYIDYITVTRLDTTYDQNGNIVVKQVNEKIPKEVKITIEEERRKRDSLFLTGKFRMTF